MKRNESKQAISLIVLVITIIVMVILAGAIVLTLNNSEIIQRASEAIDKTDKKQVEQLASLAWGEAYLDGARTQADLKAGVDEKLENYGITLEDYIVLVSTSGVEVIDANSWDHAYTCTSGSWSTRIERGKPINGDIVARFYKTGKKVTLTDEVLQMAEANGVTLKPEQDEYQLVITGEGGIGPLLNEETGEGYAWVAEVLEVLMGTKDSMAMFSTTEIIIAGEIENIANMQLSGFYMLNHITIGDGATNIEEYAFSNLSNITNVTIGDSVTSIGNFAFYGCSGLTSVIIGDSVTSIGDSAFDNCSGLTSITIGDSVTSIGNSAFYGCSGLTSVIIGDSVISIGVNAFNRCSGLTSVTIPNSVTSIGTSAFYGCSGLTSVIIGDSVISIGVHAFNSCSGLTSVTIPNSVTSIGDSAFYGCSGLITVNYTGTASQWNQITIGQNNNWLTNATINYNYVIR